MSNTKTTTSLFQQFNTPFAYSDYHYDSFNERCYVSGQSITERLNEVLGVGFWKYQGLYETEKIIHDTNGKNARVKIYVEFSFYNTELQQWITFTDVGSEQIKAGMNEGDATKSAITDGMKKCASRLGVASDLYKGLITWDKQRQCIHVPEAYSIYYEAKQLPPSVSNTPQVNSKPTRKSSLTNKLRQTSSSQQTKMKSIWRSLAGNLDGFTEWIEKKHQEKLTEEQMLQLLQRRLEQKQTSTSA